MRRVWPDVDEGEREWIVVVGIKLRQAQERLFEQLKHEHKEGRTPTSEQVLGYEGLERAQVFIRASARSLAPRYPPCSREYLSAYSP